MESENRQVLAAWKQWEGIEEVKDALPEELAPHLERLLMRRLPPFDIKEAREALADCRQRLVRRGIEAEKQATAALLAAREEEVGPSALATAAVSAAGEDERLQEAVGLNVRDMETGLRLHARERSDEGGETAQTDADG